LLVPAGALELAFRLDACRHVSAMAGGATRPEQATCRLPKARFRSDRTGYNQRKNHWILARDNSPWITAVERKQGVHMPPARIIGPRTRSAALHPQRGDECRLCARTRADEIDARLGVRVVPLASCMTLCCGASRNGWRPAASAWKVHEIIRHAIIASPPITFRARS
jgi:hypothetical protein